MNHPPFAGSNGQRQPGGGQDALLSRVLDELEKLNAQLAAKGMARPSASTVRVLASAEEIAREAPAVAIAGQLVSLDQIAAMVRLQKRSMERYVKKMPRAAVRGGRGRRALWRWSDVRTWLEETFGLPMPESFPVMR